MHSRTRRIWTQRHARRGLFCLHSQILAAAAGGRGGEAAEGGGPMNRMNKALIIVSWESAHAPLYSASLGPVFMRCIALTPLHAEKARAE